MSKNYIDVPSYICINDIVNKNYSLSPQQYKKVIIKNTNCKTINELLTCPPISGKEVGSDNYVKNSEYIFVRTKSIQEENFCIDLDIKDAHAKIIPKSYNDNIGKCNERGYQEGDILFVTGGSVGEVAHINQNVEHNIISSHILRLIFKENKYYIFAFLKSNILKEQVNTSPSGGIKGLDTFKNSYLLNAKIPFPKDNITIKYVELMVQAIINKEIAIKTKHQNILNMIQKELEDNQGTDTFSYSLPTINEIIELDRIDSCLYSEDFKKKEFLITNYKNGTSKITDLGFKFVRGNNLAISVIGKSIYSDKEYNRFYTLILPKNISKYGTLNKIQYLGNKSKLLEIKKGAIIFGAEGNEKGRSWIVLDESHNTITNFHGLTLYQEHSNIQKSIFIKLFLDYLRAKGMIDAYATGGNGGSLSIRYWNVIPFPNFAYEKEKEIVKLYHNPDVVYDSCECSVDDFIKYDNDFNSNAGIYELDKSMKLLKAKLEEVINDITDDKMVNITFNF